MPTPSLGLIGVGAFGALCLRHLAGHFRVTACDPRPDLAEVAARYGVAAGTLAEVARQDIVVLAMPVAALGQVAGDIAPHLRPGALVIDVCSIKTRPMEILRDTLPDHVDIVGTHPLFGPQSGRDGIAGLRIAVCPGRGHRAALVAGFLRRVLALRVTVTTPEAHDREMAYVQGLTHLISRTVVAMELPPLSLTTTTFEHLMRMVDTVRHDSDALFRTITQDNPYVGEVKAAFFTAAGQVERSLAAAAGPDTLAAD
jgi:prephenate dehydrogenase